MVFSAVLGRARGMRGISPMDSEQVVTRPCSGALTNGSNPQSAQSANSRTATHQLLRGLARLVASHPPELVRYEVASQAPSNNCDMRSPDQYWFKQSCKAFCGFMCSEIVVHGKPPQPDERVIEYSNHRGYADGAVVVLAQNPPPLQIAVRHDPAEADSWLGKVTESMVNPVLDFAGCLTVAKPPPKSDGVPGAAVPAASTVSVREGAVVKIAEHLAKPNSRFWAAAEGRIGDAADRGLVSSARVRTGVTVAGLQGQAQREDPVDNPAMNSDQQGVQAYALAIGSGSNDCVQYGIARIGQMLGTAGTAGLAVGVAVGMAFTQSETKRLAMPVLALGAYAVLKHLFNKKMDALVPNRSAVLAQKPVVHVQWRHFELPKHAVPKVAQVPGNPEWVKTIGSAKQSIADNINAAQIQLFQYGQ